MLISRYFEQLNLVNFSYLVKVAISLATLNFLYDIQQTWRQFIGLYILKPIGR